MLKIIISLFIFCIILFFYLHVQFHLKTSNDLEIYEVEQASKDRIEEICDLRQPVLIDFPTEEDEYKIINTTNKQFLLDNYPSFEVKIRNKNDITSETDMCVPLPLHMAINLFNKDGSIKYKTIKNLLYNLKNSSKSLLSIYHLFFSPIDVCVSF